MIQADPLAVEKTGKQSKVLKSNDVSGDGNVLKYNKMEHSWQRDKQQNKRICEFDLLQQ